MTTLNMSRVEDLLLEALETEIGGVQVYESAVRCSTHADLRREWRKYLAQTKTHEKVLRGVLRSLKIDAERDTRGRAIVRAKAEGLLSAMADACNGDDPVATQLVAAECVVDAETKDHGNWELIGAVAKSIDDADARRVLSAAHAKVEDEEDEHLYHTMGWARELAMEALGLPAELPPAEEKRHVSSMAAAARAKKARKGAAPPRRHAARKRN